MQKFDLEWLCYALQRTKCGREHERQERERRQKTKRHAGAERGGLVRTVERRLGDGRLELLLALARRRAQRVPFQKLATEELFQHEQREHSH
ncbi:hypothetical protein [Mumia zhuanghuii]|uniref:Uncharacterized protein n=1 Tax=Mumia zhuanghuii TaxID=2585211 RepID=A0A5C4M9Q5_9ACTN|nr:hypothetical protein [Mumia zhuanghuii]TNC31322.1 hypothetical protein FHE65_32145 [Mumia zhuanghuii]